MVTSALDTWSTAEVPAETLALVGSLGRIGQVVLDDDRLAAFAALSPAAPVTVTGSDVRISLLACVPDPIVTACALGLPRLRYLDRAIDGGTEWVQRRPLSRGERFDLVPRIASVDGRRTADGRRMLRTVVEVAVHAASGEQVGVVRGISLDVEERAK
jgi:hypothetical protein